MKADVHNTGTASVNIDTVGAKTITKDVDLVLETTDLRRDQIALLAYDGTQMQMLNAPTVPTGCTMMWWGTTAPSGWLLMYGQEVSMTTYEELYLVTTTPFAIGAAITFTAATSDILTDASHGLSLNDVLEFTTSNALPSGLSINTTYYVISDNLDTNTFSVSATRGGTIVDITDTGTGTQSYHVTFTVADTRGRFLLGKDDTGGASANRVTDSEADTIGSSEGAATITLTTTELPAHVHEINVDGGATGGNELVGAPTGSNAINDQKDTLSAGSGTAFSNMNPYITAVYIIKH